MQATTTTPGGSMKPELQYVTPRRYNIQMTPRQKSRGSDSLREDHAKGKVHTNVRGGIYTHTFYNCMTKMVKPKTLHSEENQLPNNEADAQPCRFMEYWTSGAQCQSPCFGRKLFEFFKAAALGIDKELNTALAPSQELR
eukprot:Protomagalhaensia_sp_Gyna_25__1537@NODE_1790_length_1537_cov_158_081442_g1468_i0_p2_GENE_NODE_1790_length_1537_cov_158_081442_g1468_i0NODE_1790_length_1537_cov_158_081442_g1468_i0_p2_ORF_typecomplete_len140_score6_37UbiqCytcred_N/PF09165_10/0_2UbiqCytcred_N/PF09165_10/9e03Colipase/PF01114_18/0_25Peptidase_M4_C/PF02868_15/0_18_NODE_1790_length_1537_cov_158_081442_g1468_i08521271